MKTGWACAALAIWATALAACSGAATGPVSAQADEGRAGEAPAIGDGGRPVGDATCAASCTDVSDCACGTDRATGGCAVGRVECIDTGRQCPDFCTGIAGTFRLACVDRRCVLQQRGGES